MASIKKCSRELRRLEQENRYFTLFIYHSMYISIALTFYGNGYLSCSCYMLASNYQLSSYLLISCPTIALCILVVMLQTHHVQSELLWSWPPWPWWHRLFACGHVYELACPCLNYGGWVWHICISKISHHWFKMRLVTLSVPRHKPNRY